MDKVNLIYGSGDIIHTHININPFAEKAIFTSPSDELSWFDIVIHLVTDGKVISKGPKGPAVAVPTSIAPLTNGFPDTWYEPTLPSPGDLML